MNGKGTSAPAGLAPGVTQHQSLASSASSAPSRPTMLVANSLKKHPVTNAIRGVTLNYVASLQGLDFRLGGNDVGVWLLSLKTLRTELHGMRKKLERLGGLMVGGTSTTANYTSAGTVQVSSSVSTTTGASASTAAHQVKKLVVLLLFDDPVCVGKALEQVLQDFTMDVIFSPSNLYCVRNPSEAALAIEDLAFVHRKPKAFLRGYKSASFTTGGGVVAGKKIIAGHVATESTNLMKGANQQAQASSTPVVANTATGSAGGFSAAGEPNTKTIPQNDGTVVTHQCGVDVTAAKLQDEPIASSKAVHYEEQQREAADDADEAFYCRETALDLLALCRDLTRMDAELLLDHFGSLAAVLAIESRDKLERIPNWGPAKARSFFDLFHGQILYA